MKKCQRAIKHYKEEERVREIRNGIESQIRNDSRRLWQWIRSQDSCMRRRVGRRW